MFPARYYDAGTQDQIAVIDWLNSRKNEPKRFYYCDTVAEPFYDEHSFYHYLSEDALRHWQSLYGRAVKSGESKGIAVVTIGGGL